ncbi:MAG: hypothetical protein PW789_16000 [Edaphobacter sp.]|uniref:hypothetical protein n=1 Tax=Edaphobacter sp. TaxID=1934404 RepID=UPI002384EC84|nr:hypothetical protein [Edaphobacter sp.]MDE1178080.1 hypothetical protein [Edaphobacter sp.]
MIRSTLITAFLATSIAAAQQPAKAQQPAETTPQAAPSTEQHGARGKVLFHRNDVQETPEGHAAVANPTPQAAVAAITDAQRSAVVFTGRDLDLHMAPATNRLSARVRFTVRNGSDKPLTQLTLQISSTLQWESIAAGAPLTFTQHTLATDADHTGEVSEALVNLPQPLAPGASLALTALYSGTLPQSAARLTRIGAPPERASSVDWDGIMAQEIALRGFGNVAWYPVSSPALFLGDGAKLFQAIGQSRLREAGSNFQLRLAIEYTGEPPVDVYVNGQHQPAEHVTEEPDALVDESHGVATANFPAGPLGFRTPSLFVSWQATRPSEDKLLSVATDRPEAITPYNTAAGSLTPLLQDWLGQAPITPLTILDHPGQPFEDDALLAIPMTAPSVPEIAGALVHSLTHAWFRSSLPWLNEGVPQFMAIVQNEGVDGRDRALAGLRGLITPLTLMEPEPPAEAPKGEPSIAAQAPMPKKQQNGIPFDPRNLPGPPESYSSNSSSSSSSTPDSAAQSQTAQPLPETLTPPPGEAGQSLIAAHDEVYYRAKAAAVLYMLRSITGDGPLKQALQRYRDMARSATPENPEDPHAFQRVLERASGKDLAWVFDDWVYNDRGLADLSITNVTPRSLTAKNGKDVSWLVAVEVHNQGNVNVEVPVTVRSGKLTTTERVRIGPQASVTTRILFGGVPDEVLVNDGSIPETVAPLHRYRLHVVDEQDTTQPAAPSTTP